MKTKIGKIIKLPGAIPQQSELYVAGILAKTGHDISFLPVGRTKSPDIRYRKLIWEIKSPRGKSSRTLENCIRAALKQSNNIIINLKWIQIDEKRCLKYIRGRAAALPRKYRIMIITKNEKILEF